MANLKVTLELDNNGYLRAMRSADDATKSFSQNTATELNRTQQSFNGLTDRVRLATGNFVKLKAALLGVAAVGLSRSVIADADAVKDLSDSTEISIGRIYELQAALSLSGGSAQNASKMITEFYKSVDEAAKGSDKTQEALAKVGVSFQDLRTQTTQQLFDQAIRGLEGIKDPALRTATAIQLFGKSMAGVSASSLTEELAAAKGKFDEQTFATQEAARLTDNYEKALTGLRMAFLKAIEPLINMANQLLANKEAIAEVIKWVKILSVAVAAVFAFTAMGAAVRVIGTIGRGLTSLISIVKNVGAAMNLSMFAPMSKFMMTLRGIGGLVAGALGGKAAYDALFGEAPPERTAGRGGAEFAAEDPRRLDLVTNRAKREVEVGKELQNQLNSIRSQADSYKRIAQSNIERLSMEAEMLGKTKEEQDTIRATSEINKRYGEQIAQLEEKKRGAKGATVALIDKEIAQLRGLQTSELDALEITQEKTRAYQRQQQEIKNIIDLMEQQEQYNIDWAQYAQQVDQARLSVWQLVDTVRQGFALEQQREALERSLVNLRGTDAEYVRKLFELETYRKQQLDAIAAIKDLPYEERLQKEAELNALIAQRRQLIVSNKIAQDEESASFNIGWANAFEKWRNNLKTEAELAAEAFSTVTRGFEDAIVSFVQTGKLSFKSLFNDLIAGAVRASANRLLMSILAGGFGMGTSGGGFFGSILGSLFGGFKAGGGSVAANKAYVVGERGPELFVPQNAGRIVPNGAISAQPQPIIQNTSVNYSIQAVDASSFRSLIARDPEFIFSVTEQGRRSLPTRSRR